MLPLVPNSSGSTYKEAIVHVCNVVRSTNRLNVATADLKTTPPLICKETKVKKVSATTKAGREQK